MAKKAIAFRRQPFLLFIAQTKREGKERAYNGDRNTRAYCLCVFVLSNLVTHPGIEPEFPA